MGKEVFNVFCMPGSASGPVNNKNTPVISAEVDSCLKSSGTCSYDNTVIDFFFCQIRSRNPVFSKITELNTNALNAGTLSLRATNGSVAISLHKQEIASLFHSSQ